MFCFLKSLFCGVPLGSVHSPHLFCLFTFHTCPSVQVRSAVRKRWSRWHDRHSIRSRTIRATSLPTSPSRVSFHSIKQSSNLWQPGSSQPIGALHLDQIRAANHRAGHRSVGWGFYWNCLSSRSNGSLGAASQGSKVTSGWWSFCFHRLVRSVLPAEGSSVWFCDPTVVVLFCCKLFNTTNFNRSTEHNNAAQTDRGVPLSWHGLWVNGGHHFVYIARESHLHWNWFFNSGSLKTINTFFYFETHLQN